MRSPLLFLLLLCMVPGCKEDPPAVPADKPVYDVKFDLSGFTRQVENMQGRVKLKAAEAPNPYLYSIQYMVYDASSGGLIRNLWTNYWTDGNHTEVNPDFGIFSDQLPLGTYKVVFLGTSGCCGYELISQEQFSKAHLGESYYLWEIPDIFFKKLDLKVTGPVLMDTLMLDRMVGNIDVRLTDEEFPEDFRSVSAVYTSHANFSFREVPSSGSREFIILAGGEPSFPDERWLNEKAFDMHVIPDRVSGKYLSSIRIKAIDNQGDTIGYKAIENIPIERNKRVVLTGSLFEPDSPSQNFVIKPDTVFSETEIIEF